MGKKRGKDGVGEGDMCGGELGEGEFGQKRVKEADMGWKRSKNRAVRLNKGWEDKVERATRKLQ